MTGISNRPILFLGTLTLALTLFSPLASADNPLLASIINQLITCDIDPSQGETFPEVPQSFDSVRDLVALHYDFAPDRDDIHSAAADRTMLQQLFGEDWMCEHVLPVSGTYGNNAFMFLGGDADKMMENVWGTCGGYIDADRHILDLFFSWRPQPERQAAKTWLETFRKGGDVWVKEGGQSDFTQKVLSIVKMKAPFLDTKSRVHVVQHSQWNEDWTRDSALASVKGSTDYIRIPGANPVLCNQNTEENQAFIWAATNHPLYAKYWKAAFKFLDPNKRLDFSDTSELLFILGWRDRQVDIEGFRTLFLH